MTWSEDVAKWRAWLLAGARPMTTVKLRTYQLRRFAEDHPRGPAAVAADDLAAWLGGQGWSVESMRSYRSALRSFFGWALASGRVSTDPAALLPPIRPTDHPPRPAPEVVVADALATTTPRVRLMIMLAARQGLRRGEIARVHDEDIVADLTGWSLRVNGKGGRVRVIPLHGDVAALLRLAGGRGFLFPGQDGGHLSAPYVGKLIAQALPDGWTAHTLRHRFATVTYARSRDLLAVQSLLGHAKPETTQHYVRMPDDALRAALAAA